MEDRACDVTINGINFSGMNKEEAVSAFEENKISFDVDKKKKFLDGLSSSLYADTYNYFYILDENEEQLYEIEVKKRLN